VTPRARFSRLALILINASVRRAPILQPLEHDPAWQARDLIAGIREHSHHAEANHMGRQ
jgi:hypothetical protein